MHSVVTIILPWLLSSSIAQQSEKLPWTDSYTVELQELQQLVILPKDSCSTSPFEHDHLVLSFLQYTTEITSPPAVLRGDGKKNNYRDGIQTSCLTVFYLMREILFQNTLLVGHKPLFIATLQQTQYLCSFSIQVSYGVKNCSCCSMNTKKKL